MPRQIRVSIFSLIRNQHELYNNNSEFFQYQDLFKNMHPM